VTESSPQLDETARRELLALARTTLTEYRCGRAPEHQPSHPALLSRSGAFVSLHAGEHLRGCIGQIVSDQELYCTVQRCAISAALEDYRFSPVVLDELPGLTIEISVLTPMERNRDVEQIQVGKHGLYVVRGGNRGLLLPQVASQYRWSRETFLSQACRKAGLPDDAWQQPATAIYTFEAQVFGE
jgi:AmmeMemoRadiSam system protein A